MLGLLLCISLAAPAGAQYEFKWKTKKGKAALTYKEKGEKVRVLTDYVYDVGVPQGKMHSSINPYSEKDVVKAYKKSSYSDVRLMLAGVDKTVSGKKGQKRVAVLPKCYFLVRRNGLYGIINGEGREVLPCRYDDMVALNVKEPNRGYAYNAVALSLPGKGWGIMRVGENGVKEMLPCEYERLWGSWNLGHNVIYKSAINDEKPTWWWSVATFVAEKDGRFALVNPFGGISTPFCDRATIGYRNGIYQLYDLSGYRPRGLVTLGKNPQTMDGVFHFYEYNYSDLFPMIIDGKEALVKRGTGENGEYNYNRGGKVLYQSKADARGDGQQAVLRYSTTMRPLTVFDCVDGYYVLMSNSFVPRTYSLETFHALQALPFDKKREFCVSLPGKPEQEGIYNGQLQKEILPCRYAIRTLGLEPTGFFEIQAEGEPVQSAFVSHSGDTTVVLQDPLDLLKLVESEPLADDVDLLRYGGGEGLFSRTAGFILPCVYDSIRPYKTDHPDFQSLFVTSLNGRRGFATRRGVVCAPMFEKVELSGDTLVLSTDHWDGLFDKEDPFKSPKYTYRCFVTPVVDPDEAVVCAYDVSDNGEAILQALYDSEHPYYNYREVASLGYELRDLEYYGLATLTAALSSEDRGEYSYAIRLADLAEHTMHYAPAQGETERLRKAEIDAKTAERERQAEAARQAAIQRRNDRLDAWLAFFQALGCAALNVGQIVQGSSVAVAPAATTTSSYSRSSASSSASRSASSSSSASSQKKQTSSADLSLRNTDQRTYDNYADMICQAYYGTGFYKNTKPSQVREWQSRMQSIRMKWVNKGVSFYQSRWETARF